MATKIKKLLPNEHQVQSAFFDLVRWKYPRCELIYAVPNGGFRHKRTAMKLKREGVKAGVWDVSVDIPADNIHGMKIEFKVGKKLLTEEQHKMQNAYMKIGYFCTIEFDAEKALKSLDDYLSMCTPEQRRAAYI